MAGRPTLTREFLISFRRLLHRSPELSWKETGTSQLIWQALEQLGLEPRRVAQHGIVADIPAEETGPLVALRADMDALPITEETNLSFASETPGVMHACGHDGHTTMLLGAASALVDGAPLKYPVRLLFQPAEETATGAKAMVKEGALGGVAAVFGGHIDRSYPVGTMIVHDGCVNASQDRVVINVVGKGGHGARPHQTVDAALVASHTLVALQTVVSRSVHPAEAAVLSIGKIQAGSQYNVIAEAAEMEGTIRTVSLDVRDEIHARIDTIVSHTARAFNASATVTMCDSLPPLINTSWLYNTVREAAASIPTPQPTEPEPKKGVATHMQCIPLPRANLGGEDFSIYLQSVPGFYVRFGAAKPGEPNIPAHSSTWDFNEDVLLLGAQYLANVARLAPHTVLSHQHTPT
eukprot:m.108487 g.108487  ORF g.108487 m.108487 type:complete len:408 (+) comp13349_c0_seq1:186-1409(+)